MAKTMMGESKTLSTDKHAVNSNSKTNSFHKIDFDEETRLAGLNVLIDSRLRFTRTKDGFIIGSEHRNLLEKANISYKEL